MEPLSPAGSTTTTVDPAHLEALLAIPHPGWIFDPATLGILEANEAAVRRYGYSLAEFRTLALTDLRRPEDVPALLGSLSRTRHTQFGYHGVTHHRSKAGAVILAEVFSYEIRFAGWVRRVAVAYDVAERERLDGALRESEARLRSLVEHGPDAVSILDAEGRIVFHSRGLSSALGYLPQDLDGLDAFSLVHPDDLPDILSLFERLVSQRGATVAAELRVRHRDGKWLTFASTARNRLDDPAVGGIVVNSRDMSEIREMENALRASETHRRQLERLEAVATLAGGFAHDVNNVLTAIKTTAEVALLDHADGPIHEDLTRINEATNRAAELTGRLLAFGRRQVLQPRVVLLNAIVEQAGSALERLVGPDCELAIELAPDLGPVSVDPVQFERVVTNLVANARDALGGAGRITVTTRNRTLTRETAAGFGHHQARPGTYAVLSVEDTGRGMDPDTLSRIFEPFFSTKGEDSGAGLGLASAYGIVKQSGGYLWAESSVGTGTRIHAFLPLAEGVPETPCPAPVRPLAGGQGQQVLIAEDDPMVRGPLRRTLERAGYAVVEASDGAEALRVLQREGARISLLLTDVVMPSMGGLPLARQAQSAHPELPVIFISAHAPDALRDSGFLGSGSEVRFLAKPFSADALLQSVAGALASAAARVV